MRNTQTTLSQYASRYGMEVVTVTLTGNKHVTGQQLTCKLCGKKEERIGGGGKHLMPPEMALKQFRQAGWEVRGRGKNICPDCLTGKQRQARVSAAATQMTEEMLREAGLLPPYPETKTAAVDLPDELPSPTLILIEEHRMAEPAIDRNAVEPDRLGKRLIHAEIAGNWNEHTGRYIGAASDQSIADALKVPRAWVAAIRIDFFGDDGTNEEIGELKAELNLKIADAEKLVEGFMEYAQKAEKTLGDLKGIRARLERIERQSLPKR